MYSLMSHMVVTAGWYSYEVFWNFPLPKGVVEIAALPNKMVRRWM